MMLSGSRNFWFPLLLALALQCTIVSSAGPSVPPTGGVAGTINLEKAEQHRRIIYANNNEIRAVAIALTFDKPVFVPRMAMKLAAQIAPMIAGNGGQKNSGQCPSNGNQTSTGDSSAGPQAAVGVAPGESPISESGGTTDFSNYNMFSSQNGTNNSTESGDIPDFRNYTMFSFQNWTNSSDSHQYNPDSTSGSGGGDPNHNGNPFESMAQYFTPEMLGSMGYTALNNGSYNDYYALSMVQAFTNPVFELQCEGLDHNGPPSFRDGPPPSLFFPGSQNYMVDFMATIFNVTSMKAKNPVKDRNRVIIIFFESMKDTLTNKQMTLSQVPDLFTKLDEGKCELKVKPFFASFNSTTVFHADHVALKKAPKPPCDYKKMVNVLKEFEEILDSMNGVSDSYALSELSVRMDLLRSSDTWIGCQAIIDSSVIRGTRSISQNSTDCVAQPNSLDFATDPCCNKTLGYSVCCARRPVSRNVPSLEGVNATSLAMNCEISRVPKLVGLLDAYISAEAIIDDPEIGCRAATFKALGTNQIDYSTIWRSFTSFLSDCQADIFGSWKTGNFEGATCKTDNDCYTSCIKKAATDTTGTCSIPWGNPAPYLQKCYLAKMDDSIKAALLRLWGVYNVGNATLFEEKFLEKTAAERCSGPSEWKYNGGWFQVNKDRRSYNNGQMQMLPPAPYPKPLFVDQFGVKQYNASVYALVGDAYINCHNFGGDQSCGADNECFYLPPSQQACESETSCSWNDWNGNPNCEVDRLKNGGFFCGQCYGGGSCFDMSQKGGCVVGTLSMSPSYNFQTNQYEPLDTTSAQYTEFAAKCDDVNSEVYFDTTQPWSQPRCELKSVNTSAQCFDACANGPKPALQKMCMKRNVASQSECNLKDANGYTRGSAEWRWNSRKQQNSWFCRAWAWGEEQCTAEFGTFGYTWEAFAQSPQEIEDENRGNCNMNHCYNPNLNSTQACYEWGWQWQTDQQQQGGQQRSLWPNYQEYLNNGKGFCTANWNDMWQQTWSEQQDVCTSLGPGWQYYLGRTYQDGVADTSAKCQAGTCDRNWNLAAEECNALTYCDKSCSGCTRDYTKWNSPNELCYHTNSTICDQDAASDPQNIEWSSNNCIYSNHQTQQCKSIAGAVTVTCDSFNDTMCTSNPFNEKLGCTVGYRECRSESECTAAGSCSDWEIQETGMCMFPATINEWGYKECFQHNSISQAEGGYIYPSKIGCAASSLNKAKCDQYGGTFVTKSKNEADCIKLQGCCEPGRDCYWDLTAKNAVECSKCGGTMQPYFNWNGGNWRHGTMVSNNWKKRQHEAKNRWGPSVDLNVMYQYLDQAVATHISTIMRMEAQCRISSVLSTMKAVACSCGTGVDASDAALCFATRSTGSSTREVSCGEASNVRAGLFEVKIAKDSIQNCDVKNTFTIGTVSSEPSTDSATTNSTLARRSVVMIGKRDTASTTATAACYAVVQNSNNAFIGQLRGDCVSFNPSGPVSGVEICMQLKNTIPYDQSTYPTFGVALYTLSESTQVYTASSIATYQSGNQYCIIVNSAGTFCPASFMLSYGAIATRSQPSCNVAQSALTAVASATAALAGAAKKLVFGSLTETTIKAGIALSSFTVSFQDDNDLVVTDAAASVTLNIVSGTGTDGAAVLGTARVAAINGVATFTDISISAIGTGYKLLASSGVMTTAQSSVFAVTAGDPAGLLFRTQPGGAVSGLTLMQPPVVAIVDAYENLVSSTASVALTVYKSGVVYATLSGATTVNAVAGLATFSDLLFPNTTTGLTLQVTSTNLSPATSSSFAVVDRANNAVKLAFIQQPATALVSTVFSLAPKVQIQDFYGNVVAGSSAAVTLSIKAGSGGSGASLSGTKSVYPIAGVATFATINIDRAATGYIFTASAAGLVSADSAAFTVNGPSAVVFTTQPANTRPSTAFSVVVEVRDLSNVALTTFNGYLTVSIDSATGTAGATLSGVSRVKTVNGVATFTNLAITTVGTNYKLIAQTDNGLKTSSTTFSISGSGPSRGPTIFGFTLSPMIIAGAAAGGAVVLIIIVVMAIRSCRKSGK